MHADTDGNLATEVQQGEYPIAEPDPTLQWPQGEGQQAENSSG